jgi:hypothetical protein
MRTPDSANHNPWHRSWDLLPTRQAEPVKTGPQEDPLGELSLRGYTPDLTAKVQGVRLEDLSDKRRATLEASSLAIRQAAATHGIGLDGRPMPPRRQDQE